MFVTFEGIEGSGKSTLMAAVCAELQAGGATCLLTREPGGTPLGERLRAVFLDPAARIDGLAEIFLLSAARAQHVVELIQPALKRNETVLCDRFYDSTVAYQGYGRGLDTGMLIELSRMATAGLEPDVTFLLDLPVALSRRRVAQRNSEASTVDDRLEREKAEFYQRARSGYLQLAARYARFVVLDAEQPVDSLLESALAALAARTA